MTTSEEIGSELVELFKTSDILRIVGFTRKESYQEALLAQDLTSLRLQYLRAVLKNHPNSSGLTLDTMEGVREDIIRTKRIYVMTDLYKFLTLDPPSTSRDEYLINGTLPVHLESLRYLREHVLQKGEELPDFKLPQFEQVAAELKLLFQEKMNKISQMQDEGFS